MSSPLLTGHRHESPPHHAFAVRAIDALPDAAAPLEVWQALSHGVLLCAQGNSGVIASQFLRGLAEVCAAASPCAGAAAIQQALAHAAGLSHAAVGEPVEGTVLTVASPGRRQRRRRIVITDDFGQQIQMSVEQLDALVAEAKDGSIETRLAALVGTSG